MYSQTPRGNCVLSIMYSYAKRKLYTICNVLSDTKRKMCTICNVLPNTCSPFHWLLYRLCCGWPYQLDGAVKPNIRYTVFPPPLPQACVRRERIHSVPIRFPGRGGRREVMRAVSAALQLDQPVSGRLCSQRPQVRGSLIQSPACQVGGRILSMNEMSSRFQIYY